MSQLQAVISKFVEDVRHTIRKDMIATLANDGTKLPPARENWSPVQGEPKKRVRRSQSEISPVEPAKILDALLRHPGGVTSELLQDLVLANAASLRVQLFKLEDQGLVRRVGRSRGTRWFRVDPS